EIADRATGLLQYALAGRGVPFGSRTEAQVQVRVAGRDAQELQRRTHRELLARAEPREQRRLALRTVRAAAGGARRRGTRPRLDAPRRFAGVRDPRPTALPCAREFATDRRLHDAEHRTRRVDERDVDRELAVALDELARTVERIDQPVARPA